jgi:hypothetical protein
MNLGNGFLLLWALVAVGTGGLALLLLAYYVIRNRDG